MSRSLLQTAALTTTRAAQSAARCKAGEVAETQDIN
jgi:hypothetical protein